MVEKDFKSIVVDKIVVDEKEWKVIDSKHILYMIKKHMSTLLNEPNVHRNPSWKITINIPFIKWDDSVQDNAKRICATFKEAWLESYEIRWWIGIHMCTVDAKLVAFILSQYNIWADKVNNYSQNSIDREPAKELIKEITKLNS